MKSIENALDSQRIKLKIFLLGASALEFTFWLVEDALIYIKCHAICTNAAFEQSRLHSRKDASLLAQFGSLIGPCAFVQCIPRERNEWRIGRTK